VASFKQGPVEPSSTLGSILDLVARSGFWACLEVCSGCWPGPWNTRRPGAYIPISLVVESVIFRLDQDPALIRQLACIALARVVRSERDGRQFLCTAWEAGALKKPARTSLEFKIVSAPALAPCVWAAVVDQKHFFTIARRNLVFVAHVSWLNGSHKRRIGRNFKTFDAAVRASTSTIRPRPVRTMRRYELRALRRALRRPARTLLKFDPVPSDEDTVQEWAAALRLFFT